MDTRKEKETKKDSNQRWSELMAASQSGDNVAYAKLLTEIQPVIFAFVRCRISDTSSIDDIVQEILIGIHNARHTYDRNRPFNPWMFTIAKYKYIDHIRKWSRTRKREISDEGVLEKIATIEEDSTIASLKEDLRQAINKLPAKQKLAVQMIKIEGLSIKEVSEKTGMSISAVKVTAHRGYKTLKKKLLGVSA